MQFPPDAATLLSAIATLLDDEVIAAVPTDLQHRVRVAAHLARLLAREVALGPDAARLERSILLALLDDDDVSTDAELAGRLADRLRAEHDPVELARAWTALVEVARGDLSIAKPGHDEWDGE